MLFFVAGCPLLFVCLGRQHGGDEQGVLGLSGFEWSGVECVVLTRTACVVEAAEEVRVWVCAAQTDAQVPPVCASRECEADSSRRCCQVVIYIIGTPSMAVELFLLRVTCADRGACVVLSRWHAHVLASACPGACNARVHGRRKERGAARQCRGGLPVVVSY